MINYIKEYFTTLKINPNQSESNIVINIIIKQLIRLYKYGKMEGVDKREKGGISNGICWNYMFDNRYRYMPKSFIKIKIRGDVYDRDYIQI